MAKGVLINFQVDENHNQTDFPRYIYSGTTENNITSQTVCMGITGSVCDLTGFPDETTEVFIKITCAGCPDKIFKVALSNTL